MTGTVRYRHIETVILDQLNDRTLAVIDGAVWPSVGDVIELHNPLRDAVVLGVRLQLHQHLDGETATVLVLVQDGEPGETIDREPTVEAVLDAPIEPRVEGPPPRVIRLVDPVEPT
jgi:hypothetical protein